MNIFRLVQRQTKVQASTSVPSRTPIRPPHRDRDFGIGYGSSSGYGVDRRYAGSAARPMFRCG